MGELGQVRQHHRGIGADVVLRAQFLQRRGGVALHQGFEQVDDAHAVGKPENRPHVLGGDLAGRVCNRLVEQ